LVSSYNSRNKFRNIYARYASFNLKFCPFFWCKQNLLWIILVYTMYVYIMY
jgi:hypothetical protein